MKLRIIAAVSGLALLGVASPSFAVTYQLDNLTTLLMPKPNYALVPVGPLTTHTVTTLSQSMDVSYIMPPYKSGTNGSKLISGVPYGNLVGSGIGRTALATTARFASGLGTAATIYMAYDLVRNRLLEANQRSLYPHLFEAMIQDPTPKTVYQLPMAPGDTIVTSASYTGYGRVTSIDYNGWFGTRDLSPDSCNNHIGWTSNNSVAVMSGTNPNCVSRVIYFTPTQLPPPTPRSDVDTTVRLWPPTADYQMPQQISDDIDKFIKNNPNLPSVADIDGIKAAIGRIQPSTDVTSNLREDMADQTQKIADLTAALEAARTSGDTALTTKLAAELEASKLREQDLRYRLDQAQQEEIERAQPPPADDPMPNVEDVTLHTIKLDPLKTIGTTLATKFPFSLLGEIAGWITPLIREPVAPTYTWTFEAFDDKHTLTINLACFNLVASVCRWASGLIITFAAAWALIHKWS